MGNNGNIQLFSAGTACSRNIQHASDEAADARKIGFPSGTRDFLTSVVSRTVSD